MDDAFERYDAEICKKIKMRPVCDDCEEPVSDTYYEVGELYICPECMERYHRREYYYEDAF